MIQCKVCFKPDSECICPECPNCELVGDPKCYKDHSLRLSRDQLVSRENERLKKLVDQVILCETRIDELTKADEDYCEEWSDV